MKMAEIPVPTRLHSILQVKSLHAWRAYRPKDVPLQHMATYRPPRNLPECYPMIIMIG
jgi:hypothetical protein